MRKRKKLTPKRVLKFVIGAIIFITLPTLLLFGFLYFKYNEDLPVGEETELADILATKMLNALNYDAYKATDYIEWTFKKRHHFKWNKTENTCEVYWKNYKVNLDLNDTSKSAAYQNDIKMTTDTAKYIKKAIDLFNNDSFWVVAPYKVLDEGVRRTVVTLENNEKALLVTYTSGGSTPGDSYLWQFAKNGKPKSFKMWTSLLPIDGLEASWNDWTTTKTGVILPTFHKLMVLGLEITDLKTDYSEYTKDNNIIKVKLIKHAIKTEKFSDFFESKLLQKDTLEVFTDDIDNYSISFTEKSFNKKPIKFCYKKFKYNVNYGRNDDEQAIVLFRTDLNDSIKRLYFLHKKLNRTHSFIYDNNNKLIGIDEGNF